MVSNVPSLTIQSLPQDGFHRRLKSVRWFAGGAVITLLITGYLLYHGLTERPIVLRMSAGDSLGRRHQLAEHLCAAARGKLQLQLQETKGSEEALELLQAGQLDVALVQGGLPAGNDVRQVASLIDEPLHLLVREALVTEGVEGLRGKRINLGPQGRGTRLTAAEVLAAVDLHPGDYIDEEFSYSELEDMTAEDRPDAIFVVSTIPSSAVSDLVHKFNYRLLPLPVGDSLQIRDRSLKDSVVPAYTYSYSPPVPPTALHTPATRLLLVARSTIADEHVAKLMEAVFESDFALRSEMPPLIPQDVQAYREYPIHAGATMYLHRNDPMIDGEFVEGLENLRSFLVSALIGLFLAWRWYVGRQTIGFERYLDDVTQIERQVLLKRERSLTSRELHDAHDQLTQIKSAALEQFCAGKLTGDTHLQSFLLHVADVRRCLVELGSLQGMPTSVVKDQRVDTPADGRSDS